MADTVTISPGTGRLTEDVVPAGQADFRRVPVTQADPARLDAFLKSSFPDPKGEFLRQHGAWWHRGHENRYAILAEDGAVAAYYTTTPVRCMVNGQAVDTLWWIDLMVAPAFRRRGLQTVMDDEVRNRPGLKLGMPNYPHSKILARHGWHVRGDSRNYLLPLRPAGIRPVQGAAGWRGGALRLAARALSLPAAAWRRRLGGYRPRTAREVASPTAAELAGVYERYKPEQMITNCRDAAFLQWRYLDAPHRDQVRFYLAGPAGSPTHTLISRDVVFRGLKATRILDIFGDFEDAAGLNDIVRLAVRDAALYGANQVTAMGAVPALRRLLRRVGFLVSLPIYFCYHTSDPVTLAQFDQGFCYWTLGDSDNDNAF
ncbi:MAG: GNAT family N-acetyltransferase [Chloroflexi bacterium]|nr:GNAT family N-acetyltransferase [Chloroflexota bacterium]MCI0579661.1 GNAT family N-acetyltransferase [Chloroflexota bacterium]MCI0645899.1 GNAT family N-acetyltransferase [Chloroflexota bacterium]MCI0725754.1 GNAT family N-acetyltransferase [Chloroflexota bacterium]